MTDDQGVRIGGGSSQASGMTLVALGDSFLEALQVEYEDTMTALLEKRLSSRLGRSIRILNTGVGGWDPNQYRIQLGKILENRRINGVVVFVYLGNDIISKHVSNIPLKQPAKRHTLRFPNSLRWNELMEAIGYPINDFFEVRSHLFIFVRTTLKYTLMKMGLTAHYFPPMLLRNQASSNSWGITADILEAIAVMGKHHDLKTLFVLLPSLSEVDPEEGLKKATAFGITPESIDFDQARLLLGEQLRRRGLSVVDMTPSLRTAIKERMPDVYGRVDTHLGRGGHQVVANAIEDVIWRMFCTPIQDPPASLLSSKNRGISAHSMFTSSEGKTR